MNGATPLKFNWNYRAGYINKKPRNLQGLLSLGDSAFRQKRL
jgi:hypothetical protein